MVVLVTQNHKICIIQRGSSSRTHPVQPVSLTGMTRTLADGHSKLKFTFLGHALRKSFLGVLINKNVGKKFSFALKLSCDVQLKTCPEKVS